MKQDEGIPLWSSVTHPLAIALEVAVGGHDRRLSRVVTIAHHSYKVCCDCASTLHDWLEKVSIRGRRRLLSALKRLQSRPRRFLRPAARSFLDRRSRSC